MVILRFVFISKSTCICKHSSRCYEVEAVGSLNWIKLPDTGVVKHKLWLSYSFKAYIPLFFEEQFICDMCLILQYTGNLRTVSAAWLVTEQSTYHLYVVAT